VRCCSAVSQAEADTAALAELIAEHDVVFLLMDTRESRSGIALLTSVTRPAMSCWKGDEASCSDDSNVVHHIDWKARMQHDCADGAYDQDVTTFASQVVAHVAVRGSRQADHQRSPGLRQLSRDAPWRPAGARTAAASTRGAALPSCRRIHSAQNQALCCLSEPMMPTWSQVLHLRMWMWLHSRNDQVGQRLGLLCDALGFGTSFDKRRISIAPQAAVPLPPELAGPKGSTQGVPAAVAPGVHPAGDEVRAVLAGRLPNPADFPAAGASTAAAAAAAVRALAPNPHPPRAPHHEHLSA